MITNPAGLPPDTFPPDTQIDLLIRAYLTAMEARDPGARGHALRVAAMATRLAALLGFTESGLRQIRRAGLLHDVGKLAVRDTVIRKPSTLTPEERREVEGHATYSGLWLVGCPALHGCMPAVLCHHERWDGSGYPLGLHGREIPLSARILAVADVYDALVSDRVYRAAWPPAQALTILAEGAGSLFDPALIKLFLRATATVGVVPAPIAVA